MLPNGKIGYHLCCELVQTRIQYIFPYNPRSRSLRGIIDTLLLFCRYQIRQLYIPFESVAVQSKASNIQGFLNSFGELWGNTGGGGEEKRGTIGTGQCNRETASTETSRLFSEFHPSLLHFSVHFWKGVEKYLHSSNSWSTWQSSWGSLESNQHIYLGCHLKQNY